MAPSPGEPPATSYDQSSDETDTGPPWGDGRSAPAWPWEKAGELTQASNASGPPAGAIITSGTNQRGESSGRGPRRIKASVRLRNVKARGRAAVS